MHEAGLFDPKSAHALSFAVFEIFDAETIAAGDAYVAEELIDGLVPIGGDSSGDRWCFDTRRKIHGTTPVLYCPHDGGDAEYVAPSFAAFVFRLIAFNLALTHIFTGRGLDAASITALTQTNVARCRP